jgi:hypothetical protein
VPTLLSQKYSEAAPEKQQAILDPHILLLLNIRYTGGRKQHREIPRRGLFCNMAHSVIIQMLREKSEYVPRFRLKCLEYQPLTVTLKANNNSF